MLSTPLRMPALRRLPIGGSVTVRSMFFAIQPKLERPPPAKIQLKPPPGEKGHFQYERDFSREHTYSKPIKRGDTFFHLFTWVVRDHKEMWPIPFLAILATTLGILTLIWSSTKIEVVLDKSIKTPPWDWSRVHDKYWKMPTVLYDPLGGSHERLEMMEKLEDQMLEKAIERGTRNYKGYYKEE